jgi:hypothetical protein
MHDTVKIGTAALGGYVLGRTKKAKAAIGLALWLTGKGRPRDIARDQAFKLLQSERGQELLMQMRGPMLAAGRQAALALVEGQAGRLTSGLQKRTEKIGGETVRTGTDTAKRLTSRRRRDQEPEEEPEEEYADEYEDEEEAYEPEEEEAYEGDEDEYADEDLEDEQALDEDEDEQALDEDEGEAEEEPEPEPERPARRRSRRSAA